MHFTKMNGAGNDFIILENLDRALAHQALPDIARALCDRRMSIGADGLMVLEPAGSGAADFRMLFYNSDGSMGEMCGNGARCVCRYGFEHGLSGEVQRIQTTAGLVTGRRVDKSNYRIALNLPGVVRLQQTLPADGGQFTCDYLELGNPGIPHAAVTYPNLAAVDENRLRGLGRGLRFHAAFPRGANVDFYELTGPDTLLVKPYERGVEDFTYACGTGAGATVAALTLRGIVTGRNVRVVMRGGELFVDAEVEDGAIKALYLTGPTRLVAAGEALEEAFLPESSKNGRKKT